MIYADKIEKNDVLDVNEATSESIVFTECATSTNDRLIHDGQPSERFAKHYSKLWLFGLFRSINMVLLFALTVFAYLSTALEMLFSNTNVGKIVIGQYADKSSRLFTVTLVALLCFGLLSAIKRIGTKNSKNFRAKYLATIGVADISFSLFCALALLPSLIKFSICAVRSLHFVLSPWLNGTTTLLELADYLKHQIVVYVPYDYYYAQMHPDESTATTTMDPHTLEIIVKQHERAKLQALMMFGLIPLMALLIGLCLLVNFVYAARLWSSLKKSGMWRADYRAAHPNCSKLNSYFAQFWPFGFLRMAIWVWPALVLLSSFSYFFYHIHDTQLRILIVLANFSFPNFLCWLHYVHRVRLFRPADQNSSENQQQVHQMANLCKMNLLFDLVGLTVYVIFRFLVFQSARDESGIQCVLWVGIVLYVASLVATVRLLYANGGKMGGGYSSLAMNLPSISINISVNVNQKNGQRENKKEKEGAEEKREEKKDNNYNMTGMEK